MTRIDSSPLLSALRAQPCARVPFWFMRQAGRYLPEYRALREKAGGFLSMVYDPTLATEVTLQPIRRFGMDAAILFSDILVIPQAMGRSLRFAEGEGPVLEPLSSGDIEALEVHEVDRICAPIYETVRGVRSGLAREGFSDTALI
ncbi:MAG TPA: uroporphyrinogen decarboxylase family protein, partial [Alphaproteobacteria bacterium]|nr:uroporphyrinogen decarboxylase family protein [Alphaproteobacteria bacterium]